MFPALLLVRAASPPRPGPRVGGRVSALPELLLVRAASPPLLEPRVGGHVSALPELLPVRAASPSLLEPRGGARGFFRLLAPFSSFSMELLAYPARDVLLALQVNNSLVKRPHFAQLYMFRFTRLYNFTTCL